ncbi:hypothetical protein KPZU09_67120 [Klebsiella pneumoniae]|uniref:Uncharacterized protein n=1 Tax=Klebsiella pneumoniae TaxID=573 RepID=A0A919HYE9_KLEPN|nr:hypothetical protein KPZU09_67120 [Klebsiella pneumoniae]
MIWSRLASSADGLAVGKDVQRAVRQLAGEIPAGGAGIEGDHHPFVNPGQRFAGDVGFMRVMAFQAHVERIAAVPAALVDHFGPAVVAQHFALRLQLAQIAANSFPADVELF